MAIGAIYIESAQKCLGKSFIINILIRMLSLTSAQNNTVTMSTVPKMKISKFPRIWQTANRCVLDQFRN